MSSEKSVHPDPKYKIILIGDCCVGKTSIFWRYIQNQPITEQPPTIIDFRYKNIHIQERQVKLCLWDTAGQEKFRSIVATYFKSCQGVVMVYDQSNPTSWSNLKDVWYQMAHKRAPTATFLVLGNKKDLTRAVPLQQVNKWCAEKRIYFVETSASTGESIEQAFFTLAALIDANHNNEVNSSFYTIPTYKDSAETTKEGSERSSVMAIYRQNRGESFFLKKETKTKKRQKCCK